MSNQERQSQQPPSDENTERAVDPGAAPGVSDAGSAGQLMGTGLAGAGTGTSIGPSRGNTGPGTGSDAGEAAYGTAAETRLGEMLGTSADRPGAEGGEHPLTPDEQAARLAQAVTPQAEQALRDAERGVPAPITSHRGLGDDDIPVETEIE